MEILQSFIQQTYNDLTRLDKNILQLRKGSNPYEVTQSMYRIVHIICGTASLYGLRGIESISAPVEQILFKATKNPTSGIETILTEYRTGMDTLLSSLLSTGEEDDDAIQKFQTSLEAQDFNHKLSSSYLPENTPIFEKSDLKPSENHSLEESFDRIALLAVEMAENLNQYPEKESVLDAQAVIHSLQGCSSRILRAVYESEREVQGFSIEPCLVLLSNNQNFLIPLSSVRIIYSFTDKIDAESKIAGDYFSEKFPWAFLESILDLEIVNTNGLFGIVLENNKKKLGLLTSCLPDTDVLPIRKQNSSNNFWLKGEALLSKGRTVHRIDIEQLVEKFGKTSIFVESENQNPVHNGMDVLLFFTVSGALVGVPLPDVEKIQPYPNPQETEFSCPIKIFTLDELQGSNTIPEDICRCIIVLKNKKDPIGVLAGKILGVNSDFLQISEEPFLPITVEELDIQGKAQTDFGLATILSKK
jgi:hypothetical protein